MGVLSNVKDNGEPYRHWCVTEVKPNGMGARVGIQQYDFIIQIHYVKISINDDIISVISRIRTELDIYTMLLLSKKSPYDLDDDFENIVLNSNAEEDKSIEIE